MFAGILYFSRSKSIERMLNKNVWLCFVFILVNLLVTAQSDDLQFRAVSPQGV